MAVVTARERAHEAFGRREWQAAFDSFGECDALDADHHDPLAECAHWLGHPQLAISSYGEAYRLHVEAGMARRAALSAFMLAIYMRLQGEGAQADGWLSRAQRLLADEVEGAEHGYPLFLHIA